MTGQDMTGDETISPPTPTAAKQKGHEHLESNSKALLPDLPNTPPSDGGTSPKAGKARHMNLPTLFHKHEP